MDVLDDDDGGVKGVFTVGPVPEAQAMSGPAVSSSGPPPPPGLWAVVKPRLPLLTLRLAAIIALLPLVALAAHFTPITHHVGECLGASLALLLFVLSTG